ncbi:unnamed protein product [Phytomonas sp. EM1]|nr:unnamed protein product [Phytomonas sp. EM1]|eukprot:CCW62181.1 unnamed protein product [Phytomonas sp. isolate EM1]
MLKRSSNCRMHFKPIDVVCSMATKECAQELALFLTSLRAFHPTLPLVIGCSSELLKWIDGGQYDTQGRQGSFTDGSFWDFMKPFRSDPHIRWVPCLDPYGPMIERHAMERERGVWYPSRHTDFMMEKANLMELAMATSNLSLRRSDSSAFNSAPDLILDGGEEDSPTVAFIDCDVSFLAPLPEIPRDAIVALSPHRIHHLEERLFGVYNGGFVVATHPLVLYQWRKATQTSFYFDQASLQTVAAANRTRLYELPPEHNYGYWRLFQNPSGDPTREVAKFSISPDHSTMAPRYRSVRYDGKCLGSVHTHFFPQSPVSKEVLLFNRLLKGWITECVRSEHGMKSNTKYQSALYPLWQ